MSATLSLIKTNNVENSVLPRAPRYRERPRAELTSGVIAGLTMHLSPGVPAASALDLACRLAGLVMLPVSVRVDGPLNALPGLVANALDRTGVAPGRLEIALTAPSLENAAIESLVALSAVRDLGVDVALHNFGGPGTLELVHYLPLSTVILKPSLLFGLPGSRAAATLLHTLLGIAREHGLRVVAAGIDAEPQRALLSGLGCQFGEGSLFGTPALRREAPVIGPNLPKH
jgi:EAL domain-containing protein (putative c-di-GMP-specific phosphodiesterase class I)